MSFLLLGAGPPPTAVSPPPPAPSPRADPTTGTGAADPAFSTNLAGDGLVVFAMYPANTNPTAAGFTVISSNAGVFDLVTFHMASSPGGRATLAPSANPFGPWSTHVIKDTTGIDLTTGESGTNSAPHLAASFQPTATPTFMVEAFGSRLGSTCTMPPDVTGYAQLDGASGVTMRTGFIAYTTTDPVSQGAGQWAGGSVSWGGYGVLFK